MCNRSMSLEEFCRLLVHQAPVEQVSWTCHSFRPKLLRQPILFEHGFVKNSAVLSFCVAILLWLQAVVNCLFMPYSLQYPWNIFEVYLPPRSDRRVISLWPLSTSTRALKFLKIVKAADFSLRMYTHNFLLKSYMKVIKYLYYLLKRLDLLVRRCQCE